MSSSKKAGLVVSTIVAVVGVGLIVASFATDHWIKSTPKYLNRTEDRVNFSASAHTANISFGLFSGYQSIDYGFSPREYNLQIKCESSEEVCAFVKDDRDIEAYIGEYHNQTESDKKDKKWFGLFSFPLYVATILMLILAMVWGLVAIGFTIFNIFGRPIETITGIAGLYVWNILAFVFTLAGILVFLSLYLSEMKDNVLNKNDLGLFTSKNQTDPDYSFYFVVGAAAAFLINIPLLILFSQKCSCSYSRSAEKEVDNGMILY